MAKYDNELKRMQELMEYQSPIKNVISNVEYHTVGADGNAYGIIKEGTKYYIKVSTPDKATISESYDYINGANERRYTEYSSYNEASKQLEFKLMSLNEKYGKNENVSTVDFKKSEKDFTFLTEEARKELNRMNQIFENSNNIGKNPEAKGHSTSSETTKNNKPFEEKVTGTLDKDPKFNGTVEKATKDCTKVGDVESQLQSDKAPKKKGKSAEQPTKAKCDLDGECINLKESEFDDIVGYDFGDEDEELDPTREWDVQLKDILNDPKNIGAEDAAKNDFELGDEFGNEPEEMPIEEPLEEPFEDEEETLDEMINDFLNGNSTETIEEEAEQGSEEFLKNYGKKGSLPVQSWDKMNESKKRMIQTITEDVCNKIFNKQKNLKENKLQAKIDNIVKEELTRLNAWEKHPRWQTQPMTTPKNTEVMRGTADRDFNDDSAKGNSPYGIKIGKSDPFTEVVNLITDQALANIKKELKK